MASTLSDLIESGITAQYSGKLDTALACYQSALALMPEDAEVLSLLGLVLTQMNRFSEAEPLLRDAVAREPDEIGFRMNLAELFTRKGLLEDATKEVMWIVSRNPGFSPAWERLGDLALLREDRTKAKADYKKAFSTVSANFNIGLKLAENYNALKEFDQALNVLKHIEKQDPNNPALFNLACVVFVAKQDWLQLESKALNWTRSYPSDPAAWQMLCTALIEQGRHRLAEEYFRKILSIRTENAEDLSVYGQICLQCFEFDKAKKALDRAEVLDPERPDLLVSLSLVHTYFGNFDQAKIYCRRALQLKPGFVPAFTQLGHLNRGQFTDVEMDCLLVLKNDATQADEHRIDIAFTIGRAYEAKEVYKLAYETYESANRLNRELGKSLNLLYDKNESSTRTQRIKALYRKNTSQHSPQHAGPCPIFIVGMPRSGTTLIESTIAAHSTVFAGGERPLFPQILNVSLSFALENDHQPPPRSTLEEWIRTYLSDLPDMGIASHFTDKNPLNIEATGLIAVLFPSAPIVHIRRNPVETCFSIFKNKFSKFWPFAHSLSDIAHFYGQYAQLVSHWEGILGDRFLTIQYEEFASHFSTMAPVLMKHCDLEWEDQCLDFQKENRAISTLSAVQVRGPVKVSPGISGNYWEFIEPLRSELDLAGIDLETGALINKMRNTVQ